jgi:hypothetical protein
MNIEKSKIFHINSRNRISGNDNNFMYSIELNKDDDFDSVIVLGCNIPKSYYMVQNGYNTFTLKINGQSDKLITIPIGNYNRRSFQASLQNLLLSASGINFIISYSEPNTVDTGKFFYSYNGLFSGVAFQFYNNNIAELMGFNKNTIINFNDISKTLISSNVLKFQLEDVIYLRSDIVDNVGVNNNVLQEIYCSNGDKVYGNINYTYMNLEGTTRSMVKSPSNIYNFYLTDEDQTPIILNGLNINFTIMCYKKNNIFQLIKGYIKYRTLKK